MRVGRVPAARREQRPRRFMARPVRLTDPPSTAAAPVVRVVKVDTKHYGLPQTRQRGYLFAWRPEFFPGVKDVGGTWAALLEGLRVPVRYPFSAFCLPDTDECVVRWRDALRGAAGEHVAATKQLGDFFDKRSSNYKYHEGFRKGEYSGARIHMRNRCVWGGGGGAPDELFRGGSVGVMYCNERPVPRVLCDRFVGGGGVCPRSLKRLPRRYHGRPVKSSQASPRWARGYKATANPQRPQAQ